MDREESHWWSWEHSVVKLGGVEFLVCNGGGESLHATEYIPVTRENSYYYD